MNYSSLEDVYGTPFHQRVPVTHERKDVKEVPIADTMKGKAKTAVEAAVESVKDSVGYDTNPETRNFRMDAVAAPRPPASQREAVREKFTSSQPANMVTDFDQSEKISRILRLIEQNKTGYERPATQDLVLYIATGIFFMFTFDTFVMLGKSMRKH